MAEMPAKRSLWARRGLAARLIAAQRSITVPKFGGRLFLDPGTYVVALGSRRPGQHGAVAGQHARWAQGPAQLPAPDHDEFRR
jgi:hypothetical protein